VLAEASGDKRLHQTKHFNIGDGEILRVALGNEVLLGNNGAL
jgi:hypothetical protein